MVWLLFCFMEINKLSDNNKIAFITCVSDERAYEESVNYIEHLRIPDGYEVESFGISEAKSMTSGFNYAMKMSDAKYKVYLHQDVMIVNPEFICEMLRIFERDDRIGLIGMVGCRNLAPNALAVAVWDEGAVYHNGVPSVLSYGDNSSLYTEVDAVDGLLMCTQVDLEWREDLFDAWDFYDISQCMEMKRAGYKCVVPNITDPWVFHDNDYSKMSKYYKYRDIFVDEYQDIKTWIKVSPSAQKAAYDKMKDATRAQMIAMVNAGQKEQIVQLFSDDNMRGYLHLVTFELLAEIVLYQQNAFEDKNVFWSNERYNEILSKIREVKFALNRRRFGIEDDVEKYEVMYGAKIVEIVEFYLNKV